MHAFASAAMKVGNTFPLAAVPSKAGMPPRSQETGFGLQMIGSPMICNRNAEIFGEGEPANYFYKVIYGCVRTYRLLDDGRRQVSAFYLPGDIFGLEAGESHRFTAEAIIDSDVVVMKRQSLVLMAAQKPDVARNLWSLTVRELEHLQDLMLTLSRKSAVQRIAAFLLEMETRNKHENIIELPMTRQDIADYLGLTIETVSRTFTQLENEFAIELLSARRVVLRNREALHRLNS